LTGFFPEEALNTAQKLDAHFKSTGKVVGPLHGLPVSIKVISLSESCVGWLAHWISGYV
jgi:Asp-tRNA(Asn)/Glu-tRNA(Gln) amidotransferase A subunit family amidase